MSAERKKLANIVERYRQTRGVKNSLRARKSADRHGSGVNQMLDGGKGLIEVLRNKGGERQQSGTQRGSLTKDLDEARIARTSFFFSCVVEGKEKSWGGREGTQNNSRRNSRNL